MKNKLPLTFENINTVLNDDEVKYLFKLLFHLSDIERSGKYRGFNVRDKRFNQFLKFEGIKLDYKNKPIMNIEKTQQSLEQEIPFVCLYLNILEMHLRMGV